VARFTLDTPVSSNNKIDRHDITQILFNVALSTITICSNTYNGDTILHSNLHSLVLIRSEDNKLHISKIHLQNINISLGLKFTFIYIKSDTQN
jgi:hypothetical protein